MDMMQWLEEHAELVDGWIPGTDARFWVTRSRGDYITHEGMEDDLPPFLPKLKYVSSIWEAGKPITMGFCEEEQKWYGWTHRAAYGFGVGSTCKKGDVHYRPVDKDDFLDDMIRFWTEDTHINVRGEHCDGGVYVEWEVSETAPNEQARGKTHGCRSEYPETWGRGEWTAETLADARQMAIDFAEGCA